MSPVSVRRRRAGTAGALVALLLAGVSPSLRGPAPFVPATVSVASGSSVDVDPEVHRQAAQGPVTVVVRTSRGAAVEVAEAAEARGAKLVATLDFIEALAATIDGEVLEWLASQPDVVAITADREAVYQSTLTEGPLGDSWFEQDIRADELHAMGIDGAGVGIAVLDSGVAQHPTLDERIQAGVDLSGDRDGRDWHGHGTFLAGLAVGSGASSAANSFDGVAPGATVIPVKVGGQNGVSLVALLQGLQWIHFNHATRGIDVVNMSFGTSSPQSVTIDPLNFAVQQLWADGLVVVVAAGNLGTQGASTITKPGDDPFVITVGSIDSMGTPGTGDDLVPDFSGRGPTLADGIAKPDLVAPGRSLVGPVASGSALGAMTEAHIADGWVRGSGTSMSTAVVAGAVALLRQLHPTWTPNQIKGALLDTATAGPVGDPNVDGHGIVDVAAAAASLAPSNPNAGIPFGTGTGSLEGTLGAASQPLRDAAAAMPSTVTVARKVTTCLAGVCSTVTVQMMVPAASLEFFQTSRYVSDFGAPSWGATQWQGNQWYGNQWYGNQWYGNQWYGNQWYGNQWYGNQWYGNQWYGNQWYGNQWY